MSCRVRCLFSKVQRCRCSCRGLNHGRWARRKKEANDQGRERETDKTIKSTPKGVKR